MAASAQAPIDGHDIVRRIANADFKDIESAKALGYDMRLPQNWSAKSKGQNIYFADTAVPRVMGALFIEANGIDTAEAAFAHIETLFTSTLSKADGVAKTTEGGLIGRKFQVSARLGGELCTFLIFFGKDSKERQLLFFAQAPQYWFNSYHALFEDILNALKAN